MSEQSSSDSPTRGMESIAHLFLSQGRGNRGRIPPQRSGQSSLSDPSADFADAAEATGPCSSSSDPEENVPETLSSGREMGYNTSQSEPSRNEEDFLMWQCSEEDNTRSSRPVRLHGVMVWTDHLSVSEETAFCFARQWAQKNDVVGFLRLGADRIELYEFQANIPCESELSAKEWEELLGEGTSGVSQVETSLQPALTELVDRCDLLLLYMETELRPYTMDLLDYCQHAVVATTPEPNDMLAAYKAIKRVSPTTWEDKDISLFVYGTQDEPAARRIYDKMAKTAWDFLAVDLHWGGWSQPVHDVAERHLAAVETREEIFEEIAEVLSPQIETAPEKKGSPFPVPGSQKEEEAEQGAISQEGEEEFEELESMGQESVEDEEVSEADMPTQAWAWHPGGAGMTPEKGEVLTPVGVGTLPRSDEELADALQLALPGWLQGMVSPMVLSVPRPSHMDPSVRFLVDGNGRLFVLGVSLTASQDVLTKALQGRKWLRDTLSILLSYCPQVRIDRSLETGVILVAGGDVHCLRESISQIREFPVCVKQLHLLQNQAGNSLLVI